MRNVIYFIILAPFLLTHIAAGSEAVKEEVSQKEAQIEFAAGLEYLSNLSRRSMILYPSFQVIPIYSLGLPQFNLKLIGSSAYFQFLDRPNHQHFLRLNYNATGDRPLYETQSNEIDETKIRPTTTEIDYIGEYSFSYDLDLTLYISKDVVAHFGSYVEARLRFKLASYALPKTNLELASFVTVGKGSEGHNKYLYGQHDAKLHHLEYGLLVVAPPAISPLFPVIEIKRFELKGQKKHLLPEDKTTGLQIIALFALKLI